MKDCPTTEVGEKGAKKWSWETVPAPIPESKIVKTIKSEIVVIGAGIAGLAAAARASELGGKVAVVEKHTDVRICGLMFGATNSKLMQKNNIKCDKEQVVVDWLKTCGDRPQEELVRLYVDRSPEVIDWLIEKAEGHGCPVHLYNGQYKGKNHFEHMGTHIFEYNFFPGQGINHAPGWMLKMQCEEAKDVDFYFENHVEQLLKKDGKIIGCVAKTKEGYVKYLGSKGVLLATGDISHDREMLECFAPVGLLPKKVIYPPKPLNTGDGHKMGFWVGAQPDLGDWPTMLHPLAYSWQQFGFIHVNTQGNRFMNEDTWIQAKSIKILTQPGNKDYAFTVFDSNWKEQLARTIPVGGGQFWDGMERNITQEWTPDLDVKRLENDIESGIAFKADTLEELADLIGVDKKIFSSTIKRYNELSDAGVDSDYGKNPIMLNSIKEGPFYATKHGPALLAVTGGLLVNNKIQVLDENHQPIPGLYAAGNVSGGRYGVDYPVTINGTSLMTATMWGYIASETMLNA
ncbi:FAD-binding protein [Shewanella intestini]|uniref:FAD-binding protein n=1 Tax=Shewanella intestini TaxID=2017544 RepID=A0ABS5I1J8_9GAMM|nr:MULTISPECIES: FAD-binding protein [Shewanella]MBR9727776.1 FAD-binding protein [Shewanella intestini]